MKNPKFSKEIDVKRISFSFKICFINYFINHSIKHFKEAPSRVLKLNKLKGHEKHLRIMLFMAF